MNTTIIKTQHVNEIHFLLCEGRNEKKKVTNRDWEGKENIKQNHKLGF